MQHPDPPPFRACSRVSCSHDGQAVGDTGLLSSFELVEVNPALETPKGIGCTPGYEHSKTLEAGMKLIAAALGSRIC